MTSPTDNEIIEAVARAICVQHQHEPDDELPTSSPDVIDNAGIATIVARPRGKQWMIFMEDAQAAVAAAEPLIIKRAQEAVLLDAMDAVNGWSDSTDLMPVNASKWHAIQAIKKLARKRGITLDGDGNG